MAWTDPRAWRGRLIGVQNGSTPQRVLALDLATGGRRVERVQVLDVPPATGEATIGTVIGDRYIYVSSSQWPFWSEHGARNAARGPSPSVTVREITLRERRPTRPYAADGGSSTISSQYFPSTFIASTRPVKVTGFEMNELTPSE